MSIPENTSEHDIERNYLKSAIEAILIVADEPVTAMKLAQSIEISPALAVELLEELAKEYCASNTETKNGRSHGFILCQVAGGWCFASSPAFADLVKQFIVGDATTKLSQAALETLAVIAYKQPVSRGRVGAIRGVNVDGVMRNLQARGLIVEIGSEASGALLYGTTNEFLEYLGINTLEDLPPLAPYLPDSSLLDEIEEEVAGRN